MRGHGSLDRVASVIAVTLFVVTAALYARAVSFDYVNYDDDIYTYANAHVQDGLSWRGVRYAFTTADASNWHPLTWLSLQADVSLFGRGPRGHHATNVVLHALNAALLFLALLRLTGERWPAAACAALFALHPLRVESVAWIAERRDVLCGLFWIMTMFAHAAYARAPGWGRYGLVTVACAAALLAKPMAVTLPFALLLLDYWPLRRWRGGQVQRVILEKVPLLACAAVMAGLTVWAQKRAGAVSDAAVLPVADRVATAAFACVQYLWATLWPTRLAAFYPHRFQPPNAGLPLWTVTIPSLLLVTSLLAIALGTLRRAPWFGIGLLWFFGTLVPVIGLVQVGLQSHADRYTYIPSIGLGIAVCWSVAALVRHRPELRWPVGVVSGAVLVALALASHRQVGFWRDSQTLWRRAIAVVPRNYLAHSNLGHALYAAGERSAAVQEFRRAVEINPHYAPALHNLGAALAASGDRDHEAETLLRRASAIDSGRSDTYVELARLYERQGRADNAVAVYQQLLERDPRNVAALHGVATHHAQRGDFAGAIPLWRSADEIAPNDADVQQGLGVALVVSGRADDAVEHLRRAVEADPNRAQAMTFLAWVLATSPGASDADVRDALDFARRAVESSRDGSPRPLDALAAAQARSGRFEDAVRTVQSAIDVASARGEHEVVLTLNGRKALYESGRPYVR